MENNELEEMRAQLACWQHTFIGNLSLVYFYSGV